MDIWISECGIWPPDAKITKDMNEFLNCVEHSPFKKILAELSRCRKHHTQYQDYSSSSEESVAKAKIIRKIKKLENFVRKAK